ncbi:NAD-dependent epimerase/dehydratase family protein [Telmatospirillum siberiense]|uniref:UDP-glucuronate decarboxylase n=1 Tax=Telmatospirillum siberiense TaxID=382514 RepID=A0A2N3Q042_9PROT|nr:NAD-dependent epimerase/dehydratase family protein [Telmatospirillum siberiense]PKU25981.1 UDP-glucuronate decarboxylase [Telmatospirillum siberiense]
MAMNPVIRADVADILAADLPWESFAGTTVLVSGASGLLASYMVEVLLAMREHKGFGPTRLLGLVRDPQKAWNRFPHLRERNDFTLITGDVIAPPPIEGPVNVIIHAASIANSRQMMTDPAGTLTANMLGTYRMLELGREQGSRHVLFFSSGEVCGSPEAHQIPMREDVYGPVDPADARACYAEGKRVGETMCAAWAQQYGLETRIVRPFHTYGPGMNLAGGWVHSDFINDIMARRNLVITSDGLATRSFCYIADATLAYFTVMLRGQRALPYNVGTGVETSIRGLADLLVEEFGELGLSVVIEAPASPSPPKRSAPDISRLASLGWHPRTTIAQGFRRTIESFGGVKKN